MRRRPQQSLEAIYCAELVATTYQAHGPAARASGPPSWYDPGRFWSGDRLELVPPFALGGEIAVSVPDPPERTEPDPSADPNPGAEDAPQPRTRPRLRLPQRSRRPAPEPPPS